MRGRFVLGLIARIAPGGKILVAYLFRDLLTRVPAESKIPAPDGVLLVARIGDLGLIQGRWPVVKRIGRWDRKRWPLPAFGRREPLSDRAWRVAYRDDNPNSRPKETLVTTGEAEALPPDGVYGHIALERLLAHKLGLPPELSTAGSPNAPTAFHVVSCPTATSAHGVALFAHQHGLGAEVRDAGDHWNAIVAQPMPANASAIAAIEEGVREIAAACGAEYAGFERGL